jgi:hypothetical protein
MKILVKLLVESSRHEMHDPLMLCGNFDSKLEILYAQIVKTTTILLNPISDFMKKLTQI